MYNLLYCRYTVRRSDSPLTRHAIQAGKLRVLPLKFINSPSLLRQQAHQRDATCKICRTARTAEALDDDGVHFGSAVAGPDDQLNEYLPNYPMDKDLFKAISVHPGLVSVRVAPLRVEGVARICTPSFHGARAAAPTQLSGEAVADLVAHCGF